MTLRWHGKNQAYSLSRPSWGREREAENSFAKKKGFLRKKMANLKGEIKFPRITYPYRTPRVPASSAFSLERK